MTSVTKAADQPKKSQPSRKGKKAWRKNIDLTKEEESIHEIVKEKMEYGVSMNKVDDDCLFTISTQSDPKLEAKALKKQSARDKILSNKSAFPAITPRTVPKAKMVSSKQLKIVEKALNKETKPDLKSQTQEISDPWGEEPSPASKKQKLSASSNTEELDAFTIRKKHLTDLELKHSGSSYNPTVTDIKALKKISAKIAGPKLTSDQIAQKEILIASNSVDLAASAHEMVAEQEVTETIEDNDTFEVDSKIIKIMPKPLSKKARRNKLVVLQNKRMVQAKLLDKKLDSQLHSVKKIKKQVEAKIKENKIKNVALTKKRKLKDLLPSEKLGGLKVPKKPVAVALKPSESLRQIKTTNNLYRDHFVGLQARNLIEPPRSNRKPFRLPRFKLHTRASHKY